MKDTSKKTTHTSSTNAINKAIKDCGIENVTLKGGKGYQYFVYSTPTCYDSQSEMVCYVRDLSIGEWVKLAGEFYQKMIAR